MNDGRIYERMRMKSIELKRREANERQAAYNADLDSKMKRLKVAKSRLSLLNEVSPSQRERLSKAFKIDPETGESLSA